MKIGKHRLSAVCIIIAILSVVLSVPIFAADEATGPGST